MWTTDESLGEVQKSPATEGYVRAYFSRGGGLCTDSDIIARTVYCVFAPSGRPYAFKGTDERISEWEPVYDREDISFFEESGNFEVRGVQ